MQKKHYGACLFLCFVLNEREIEIERIRKEKERRKFRSKL